MGSEWSVRQSHADKLTTRADLAVARLAARQWGVLSLDELLSCGLSRDAVWVRVQRGGLHPLHRAVYAVGHTNLRLEGRFLAAVKACGPDAVLSHHSAAALFDLLPWDGRPVEITAPTRRRHPGLRTHRTTSLANDTTRYKCIPTTTRLRTLTDLAATGDERTLIRAVRAAHLTPGELDALNPRGRLRRIVDTSTAPTRTRLEDIVLDLMLEGGLAHPEVNARYPLPDRTYYPDFRWPARRLIVEADSRAWHDDPLTRRNDAERQARLEAQGERVIRVTWNQATRRPAETLARLRAAGAPGRHESVAS